MDKDKPPRPSQFGLRAYLIFVSLAAIGLALLVGPVREAWEKGGIVFIPYHLFGSELYPLLPVMAEQYFFPRAAPRLPRFRALVVR